MTSITYNLVPADLLFVGFSHDEVDGYEHALTIMLLGQMQGVGAVTVSRIERVSGMRRVVIVSDDVDVDPYALETRVCALADDVFESLFF